jgi:hypothetical protein
MVSSLLSGRDLAEVQPVISRHRGTAMPEPFVLTEELPQKPGRSLCSHYFGKAPRQRRQNNRALPETARLPVEGPTIDITRRG